MKAGLFARAYCTQAPLRTVVQRALHKWTYLLTGCLPVLWTRRVYLQQMEARCGVRGSSELIADRPAPHIGHRYHAVSAGVPGLAASLSRFSSSAGRGFLPACPVVALEECAEGRGEEG